MKAGQNHNLEEPQQPQPYRHIFLAQTQHKASLNSSARDCLISLGVFQRTQTHIPTHTPRYHERFELALSANFAT